MLTIGDVALLGVISLALATSLAVGRLRLRSVDMGIRAYRFFKVRDDLIFLVASGKLSEEGLVFQTFYEATNAIVANVDKVNLRTLVAVIERQREAGKDPAERQRVAQLAYEVKQHDPEVGRVVSEYYKAVAQTLLENSLLVRVLVKNEWLRKLLKRVAKLFDTGGKPPTPYQMYKDNDRALHSCC